MSSFSDSQLDRTSIHLNATDVISKNGSRYKYRFPRSFSARKMRLRHAEIAGSATLVHSANNSFSVSYDGDAYLARTITISNDSKSLSTELQTVLKTVHSSFAVNDNLNVLTITAGATFKLKFSSAWGLFGFDKDVEYDSGGGTTITAPNCTRYDGTSIIDITTDSFGVDSFSSKKANCIGRVHTLGPASASFYTAETEQYLDLEGVHLVREIEIQLTDEFGHPHNLRGCAPTLSFDFIRSRRPN